MNKALVLLLLRKGWALPALGFIVIVATACPEPIPLYGTWADNNGNTLTFGEESVFGADVTHSLLGQEHFSGTYTVLLNALTITCSAPRYAQIVTEWDIRGNMLYIDWTNSGETIPLTLYKVSN
jgi:hypothetical protein